MKKLITRLFAEAPEPKESAAKNLIEALKASGATSGFLECQLTLKGGLGLAGILTITPELTLRMISMGKNSSNAQVMVESYFDYDDVLTVMIGREIPRATNANRSPLIIAP